MQGGQGVVNGLQLLLQRGELAFGERGLGLQQQGLDLLALLRAGMSGAGARCRAGRCSNGAGRRRMRPLPGFEALHEQGGKFAVGDGGQRVPALRGRAGAQRRRHRRLGVPARWLRR